PYAPRAVGGERVVVERFGGPPRGQGGERQALGEPRVGVCPVVEAAPVLDRGGRPGRAEAVAGAGGGGQRGGEWLPAGTNDALSPSGQMRSPHGLRWTDRSPVPVTRASRSG